MGDAPNKITITICGDGGCGMSCNILDSQSPLRDILILRAPTEDSYSVTRTIDGQEYFLSITDTAGQEEYRSLWAASNLDSDAFLLVYDITSESSLGALDYFMEMIDMETETRAEKNAQLLKQLGDSARGVEVGRAAPVRIVAGNKCDLKDNRVISAKDGLEYARKHNSGFMETSAREMVNIEETFALLVRRVIEARRDHYQFNEELLKPTRRVGFNLKKRESVEGLTKKRSDANLSKDKNKRQSIFHRLKGRRDKPTQERAEKPTGPEISQMDLESSVVAPSRWKRLCC
ncbi:P-loop containing nucleoside triphosphate hydrolase protein [Aspergillus filifer]